MWHKLTVYTKSNCVCTSITPVRLLGKKMLMRAAAFGELTRHLHAISQVYFSNSIFAYLCTTQIWACSKAVFWYGDLQLHWVCLLGSDVNAVFEAYPSLEGYKMPYLLCPQIRIQDYLLSFFIWSQSTGPVNPTQHEPRYLSLGRGVEMGVCPWPHC